MLLRSRDTGAFAATLLVGCGLFFSAAPAHAADAYDTAVLADNPLAYFPLNSVNQGSLVNGFTTTFNGGLGVTAPGGGAPIASDPGNTGAAFSGAPDTSGYGSGPSITTSLGSANPTTASTILGWFNLAQLPSVGNPGGGAYYIAGRSSGGNDLDLQINSNNVLAYYTASGFNIDDPTAITTGQSYFFAATEDASAQISDLYINGNLVASNSVGGTVGTPKSTTFTIGDSDVFPNRNFDGTISNVAYYGSALSASQVQTIYNASFTPAASNAVPEASPIALLALGLLPFGVLVRTRLRRRA